MLAVLQALNKICRSFKGPENKFSCICIDYIGFASLLLPNHQQWSLVRLNFKKINLIRFYECTTLNQCNLFFSTQKLVNETNFVVNQ